MLTVLEGSTFCVCDEFGDVAEEASGFFAEDTRFLSRFALCINGQRPLLLSSGKVDYFSAAFYLRNPVAGGLEPNSLTVSRARFVGEGMQEHVTVENQTSSPLSLTLEFHIGADFADIISVKEHHFALADPARARLLPPSAECRFDPEQNQFVLIDSAGDLATQVIFTELGEPQSDGMRFRIDLPPRGSWEVRVDVVPGSNGSPTPPPLVERQFTGELERVRESLEAWRLRTPELRATWRSLHDAFGRSLADITSLRIRGGDGRGSLPAAGMPWFMTVFGRDTLITALQTLLLGPELAYAALEELAELQATEDDASIDAEPGKIVHEVRRGKCAERWFARYYGTVDATPLFLVLLSELWRWTNDHSFVAKLHQPALAALEWIDRYGDRDGDGFVEYERRTSRGLENQSWKDSGNSQCFADGSLARAPIAPCEVQGYVYDAKRRSAELAREVWHDPKLAARLDGEATELRERFDAAFWIEKRGGYYALALDRNKRPVDSLTSNIGHLLWSGIAKPERIDAVVDRLMGHELWSGWGVRTMSSGDAGYNPLGYHNGTVWPHDNSLIALGLASCGRRSEALRIVRRIIQASEFFDHELPEVFAGLSGTNTPFPIAYPVAARPQAWAAGTPVLLLQLLLGLRPEGRLAALVSDAPEPPSWAGTLRLSGVRAFDRRWTVRLGSGRIEIAEEP